MSTDFIPTLHIVTISIITPWELLLARAIASIYYLMSPIITPERYARTKTCVDNIVCENSGLIVKDSSLRRLLRILLFSAKTGNTWL